MILDMFSESMLFGNTDSKINENYLEDVEAIPVREGEDPLEACYRIAMENEQNWYNIVNTIAFSELAFMESHGPDAVVYEAADLKKIKDTIITWIKTQWAKLKGVFKSVSDHFSEMIGTDKALLKLYDAKKDKIADKQVTKSGFLSAAQIDQIQKIPSSMFAEVEAVNAHLFPFDKYESDKDCESLLTEYKDKKIDKSKIKEDMDKILSTPERTIKVSDAAAAVKAGKQLATVKNLFKDTENKFNDMIKTFNKEKSTYTGEASSNASKIITLKSRVVKMAITDLTITCKKCLQAVNRDYNLRRAVLKKAVGEKVEDKKDEKKTTNANESAELICTLI